MKHQYAQMDDLAKDLPENEEILKEALLLQLRATRAAALVLDLDITNNNSIKLLGDQVGKLMSVVNTVQSLSSVSGEAADNTIALDFSLEPTEYQSKDDLSEFL